MSAIKRVSYLTTTHPDLSKNKGVSYADCKGCSVCDEIVQLRSSFNRPSNEKFKHILDKGPEMTTEDIKFLIENEVPQTVIKKKTQLKTNEFYIMLNQLGLANRKYLKKEMDDMALTKEQLLDYEKAGVGPKEIAKKEGVSPGTVYTARSLHGLTKNKSTSPKKAEAEKQYDQVKKEVAAALATDDSLVKELKSKISGLEQELAGKNHRVEELEKADKAKVQWINDLEDELKNVESAAEDLEKENSTNLKLIHDLKVDKENLMVQVAEWKDNAHSYAKDNDLMNSTNKHLKSMMEGSTRKANILAAALKEVL